MKTIHQSPTSYAWTPTPKDSPFQKTDMMVDGGGILKANQGAASIKLIHVASKGSITGGGNYRVLLATKPVKDFLWNNLGMDHEITNGGEAGIRVMGGAGNVTLVGVNFRCRKHDQGDDTGSKSGTPGVPQVWWKQVQQWRDVRKGLVQGGRTIGPINCGEQKNTALTPQHVDDLTFDGHAMTELPTITTRKSIGKITIKNCPKIDESGNKIGMWKNQTL